MSTEKYPLIKACGLFVHSIDSVPGFLYAHHLEAFLAKAPIVEVYPWSYGDKVYWRTPNMGETSDTTHTARLICIEEIKQESAEDLLRELVDSVEIGGFQYDTVSKEFRDRAKRLLERSGK